MRLFSESPPPPPGDRVESLGERVARAARQAPAGASKGKAIAMLVLAAVTVGGVLVTLVGGPGPAASTVRRVHEEQERQAAREAADAAAARAPAPSAGALAPAPPLPAPGVERAVRSDAPAAPAPAALPPETSDLDFAGLAASIYVADAEHRPALRAAALALYAALIDRPASQRVILIDAARLAPDLVPEEAPYFAQITRFAVERGLRSAEIVGVAVLYLGSLRDRGGPDAVVALEALVLDDARPLEARVAAARVLPEESRARAEKQLNAPPAERPSLPPTSHPALRAALRPVAR